MAEFLDIKMFLTDNGYYDFFFEPDGDFVLDDSFDTIILTSLTTFARADVTESPIPEKRRGWEGNEFNPEEFGGVQWLLEQSRLTNDTVNKAEQFYKECLIWMVPALLKDVVVTGERNARTLRLLIELFRHDGRIERRYFEPWEKTGLTQA